MLRSFSVPFWFANPILQTIVGNLTPPIESPKHGTIERVQIKLDQFSTMVYRASVNRDFSALIVPNWGQCYLTGIILRLSAHLQNHGFAVKVLQPATKNWDDLIPATFLRHKQQQIHEAVKNERPDSKIVLLGLGLGATAALAYSTSLPKSKLRHVIALSPFFDLNRLQHRLMKTANGLFSGRFKANSKDMALNGSPELKILFAPNDFKAKHHILLAKDDPFISSYDLRLAQTLGADIFDHGGHCGFVTIEGTFESKYYWLDNYIIGKIEGMPIVR